jgi:hypothetical protein
MVEGWVATLQKFKEDRVNENENYRLQVLSEVHKEAPEDLHNSSKYFLLGRYGVF